MRRFCYLLVIGWLGLPLMANADPVPGAQLTPEQHEWLVKHRELRVGLVLQAPYAQFVQRLQRLSGANVELMKWLALTLNVELIWRNYPDLRKLEAAARAGEIDVVPGMTQTPEGLRLWQFSDPYMRVSQLVIGVRDGNGAVDLERLGGQTRVAVRMPSATADYLRSSYPGLNLQGVPLERQALQLLLSQQAAYAVIDEAQFSRLSTEAAFAELASNTVAGKVVLLIDESLA